MRKDVFRKRTNGLAAALGSCGTTSNAEEGESCRKRKGKSRKRGEAFDDQEQGIDEDKRNPPCRNSNVQSSVEGTPGRVTGQCGSSTVSESAAQAGPRLVILLLDSTCAFG